MLTIYFIFYFKTQAASPKLVYQNNQAAHLIEKEMPTEASRYLEKKVVLNPDSGELKYNLGLALEQVKEEEKAIQEYDTAYKVTRDSDLQFQSLFNLARLYGQKKEIEKALSYYQKALEIRPDSKEVKTNIELLFQASGQGQNQNQQSQQNKNDQDQQQQKQSQSESNPNTQENKKNPRPFKSQELTEQDVKRILEELKRQEEQLRAKMLNQKQSKEQDAEKNW